MAGAKKGTLSVPVEGKGRSQSLAKDASRTRRGFRKLLYIAKKGVEMKTGLPKAPADLDREGKKRWKELVLSVDPDDLDLLGNLCRQHSSLLALRAERAQMVKAGTFQQLVKGRDGSMQLNPMTRREDKLVLSTSRMLRQMGLASTRDARLSKAKSRVHSEPRPKWAPPDAVEPCCGWEIESVLCGYKAWNPNTQSNEDVPEGHPDHPDQPDFKRRVGRLM
jgi:phage terminase small subunit